jgi:hypothetical protein
MIATSASNHKIEKKKKKKKKKRKNRKKKKTLMPLYVTGNRRFAG